MIEGTTKPSDSRLIPPWRDITLRDYFAARAMQAILESLIKKSLIISDGAQIAKDAYHMADAMIEARK